LGTKEFVKVIPLGDIRLVSLGMYVGFTVSQR
jgi:hypothetical protein